MTEQELQWIERELGITLPPNYRQWALTAPPPQEDETYQDYYDAKRLVEINRDLRERQIGWGWYDNFFFIGGLDKCSYDFILLDDDSKIYQYEYPVSPPFDPDKLEWWYYRRAVGNYGQDWPEGLEDDNPLSGYWIPPDVREENEKAQRELREEYEKVRKANRRSSRFPPA